MTTRATFAVLGDTHGLIGKAARQLEKDSRRLATRPDFALQVGDFEPHRHDEDLRSMDAPSKYKALGDFVDFYEGRQRFCCPLYFIGGNHEPYGWLEEHTAGAELADQIHYIGRAEAIEVHGLRVVGLSGIYNEGTFAGPRPPISMLDELSNKSWIYFNEADIERALELERADILVVHEWPDGIVADEDLDVLGATARRKGLPLGNPWARVLLDELRPRLVICGHMHTFYHRELTHSDGSPCDVIALGHMRTPGAAIRWVRWGEGGELEIFT